MALNVGTKAPDFTLPSTSGEDFTLSKNLKNKACIIYFYPKDFTPGCNMEACGFRDNFEEFEGLDIDIVGISKDSIETHQRFINYYKLPFELLSDQSGEVLKKYEALIPFIGMPKRITYLLDTDHNIITSYENLFGAKKHIQEMLLKTKTKLV